MVEMASEGSEWSGGGGGTSRQLSANPRSVGMSVGSSGTDEPRNRCRRLPPLFIAAGDRGPPTIKGRAPPIRALIKELIEPLDSVN